MPKPRPTLRSLAAEAGVSLTTMSFALRDSREVSPATRARLQRLAAARGYRCDPHVTHIMSRLRAKGPARAAVHLCGLGQNWGPAPAGGTYFTRLVTGMRRRAESLGFAFNFLDLDDYPDATRLERVLLARGVDGVLLLPLRAPADLSARLDWGKFSVVSVASSVLAPGFHSVTPSHYDNMLLACRELAQRGYRRIGLAMSRDWDLRVRHRWSGGIAWQNQFGGTEPVQPLIYDRPGPNLDADALRAWLRSERPDVVILEAIDRSGFERAVAALPAKRRPDCATMNWPAPVAAAGIDQQVERIGAAAVELLGGMIARGEKGIPPQPTQSFIEGTWRTTETKA